jgi:hypothetical protein
MAAPQTIPSSIYPLNSNTLPLNLSDCFGPLDVVGVTLCDLGAQVTTSVWLLLRLSELHSGGSQSQGKETAML